MSDSTIPGLLPGARRPDGGMETASRRDIIWLVLLTRFRMNMSSRGYMLTWSRYLRQGGIEPSPVPEFTHTWPSGTKTHTTHPTHEASETLQTP